MFINNGIYYMRLFLLLGCLSAILMPCGKAWANITLALVTPKAGTYEQQGVELTKGVQQAIDEINNDGGLLGKKLELLVIDDQCNDSIAVSTAQMLSLMKAQNIRLVIGPYCANSFDKVTGIYANAQIFQIIPTTVNYSQAKTIRKGLIKMLGYTNQQAEDFFGYYNSTMAGKKVAIIYNVEDEESIDEAKALNEEFRKHGKSVVIKSYTYDITDKDYDKLADMVQSDGNSVAFILGTPKNIRKMARSLKENDKSFELFVNKYSAGADFAPYMGKLIEGVYFMALSGREDDPEFAETLVRLRLNGFDTEGLALYGYSAVNLWKELVKKTKSFDYNKLSAQINHKNVETDFGQQLFHNGAPDTNEAYAIYRYEDGGLNRIQ